MIDNIKDKFENHQVQYLFLALITVFAAVLRFYKLGEWSLWVEEFHTIRHTAEINSFVDILGSLRDFYYVLNKPVFLTLGETEWTARLLPVVFGIIAIPLIYWITKKLFGFPTAILAAILLALSPWHLYWSQNARFYTLFLILFNISFITFYFGIENNRFSYIAVSIITLILAAMTHLMAALIIPVFIIYYLLIRFGPFRKPAGLKLRNILPFIILPILGYVVFEFILNILDATPLYMTVYDNFISDARIFPGYQDPLVMLKSVIYYIGTPLSLASLFGSAFLIWERRREGLIISFGAFLPIFILMVISPIVTVVNRYVFMTLPFWVILAAYGVYALYQSKKLWLWILYFIPLLVLLIRDSVIDDLLYHVNAGQYLPLVFMVAGFLVFGVVVWLVFRRKSEMSDKWNQIIVSFVLLVIFIHPIIMTTMYFEYQHGHRDNLKAATNLIATHYDEMDRVVVAIPLLVEYYLEADTEYVQDFNADIEPSNNQRIWIIEDYGFDQSKGESFGDWTNQNCSMEGKWDNFTAGRIWKMRVYLCES